MSFKGRGGGGGGGGGMLDYYIVRFILYFPSIVIFIFQGLYSLAYIRPSLVLVIHSL